MGDGPGGQPGRRGRHPPTGPGDADVLPSDEPRSRRRRPPEHHTSPRRPRRRAAQVVARASPCPAPGRARRPRRLPPGRSASPLERTTTARRGGGRNPARRAGSDRPSSLAPCGQRPSSCRRAGQLARAPPAELRRVVVGAPAERMRGARVSRAAAPWSPPAAARRPAGSGRAGPGSGRPRGRARAAPRRRRPSRTARAPVVDIRPPAGPRRRRGGHRADRLPALGQRARTLARGSPSTVWTLRCRGQLDPRPGLPHARGGREAPLGGQWPRQGLLRVRRSGRPRPLGGGLSEAPVDERRRCHRGQGGTDRNVLADLPERRSGRSR